MMGYAIILRRLAHSLHAEDPRLLSNYYTFKTCKWIYICTGCEGGITQNLMTDLNVDSIRSVTMLNF